MSPCFLRCIISCSTDLALIIQNSVSFGHALTNSKLIYEFCAMSPCFCVFPLRTFKIEQQRAALPAFRSLKTAFLKFSACRKYAKHIFPKQLAVLYCREFFSFFSDYTEPDFHKLLVTETHSYQRSAEVFKENFFKTDPWDSFIFSLERR